MFSYIREHNLIHSQDRILAGVSGGADSVCLLFLLLEYRKRVPLELAVSHVNHGYRADAAEDARYVEELCTREGLPYYLTEGNMEEIAYREKCSMEDAGRRLRYRSFGQAAAQFGAGRIAVAHNANDRAETMLFHLFRGSGLKGLCGIAPRRQEIIRPILCLERWEVERYLEERGIAYCTDSTNGEDGYTRNRIRHYMLPYAQEQVSSGAVAHMCQTADMLAEISDYLEGQVALARGGCVTGSPATAMQIQVHNFLKLHVVLQKYLLLGLLQEWSPTGKDILAVHVRDVLELFTGTGNRKVDLPFGIQAMRSYGQVILGRKEPGGPDCILPGSRHISRPAQTGLARNLDAWGELPCEVKLLSGDVKGATGAGTGRPAVWQVVDGGTLGSFHFRQFFPKSQQEIPLNRYTKWFDCDKMREPLDIRFRQTGDYITIADGRGGMIHKSLKDYMVTEKIPRLLRDRIPVLAEGKHVLWLVGYRISEYYKISGNTKHVLQVQLIGGCAGSETEDEDDGTYQGTIVGGRGGCQDPGDWGTDQQGLCGEAGASGMCTQGGQFFHV